MFDQVGGTQIVRDEGHFGDIDDGGQASSSSSPNKSIRSLPSLLLAWQVKDHSSRSPSCAAGRRKLCDHPPPAAPLAGDYSGKVDVRPQGIDETAEGSGDDD
jgi:hypothetical protein